MGRRRYAGPGATPHRVGAAFVSWRAAAHRPPPHQRDVAQCEACRVPAGRSRLASWCAGEETNRTPSTVRTVRVGHSCRRTRITRPSHQGEGPRGLRQSKAHIAGLRSVGSSDTMSGGRGPGAMPNRPDSLQARNGSASPKPIPDRTTSAPDPIMECQQAHSHPYDIHMRISLYNCMVILLSVSISLSK